MKIFASTLGVLALAIGTGTASAALLFSDDFPQAPINTGWIEVEAQNGTGSGRVAHDGSSTVRLTAGTNVDTRYFVRRFNFSGVTNATLDPIIGDEGGTEGADFIRFEYSLDDGSSWNTLYQDNSGVSPTNPNIDASALDGQSNVLIRATASMNAEVYTVDQIDINGDGSLLVATSTLLASDNFDDLDDWTTDNGTPTLGSGFVNLNNNDAISTTLSTSGYDYVVVRIDGFTNGDIEGADDMRINVDFGGGFVQAVGDASEGDFADFESNYRLLPTGAWDQNSITIQLVGITNGETYEVDNFEVFGLPTVAIPEPASAGLLGLAGLVLLRRRRRAA